MRLIAIFILTVVLAPAIAADSQRSKKQCAKIKDEIRVVQSKMRAGYTRAQGEKLEARLRTLRKKRRTACR